jgi:hypothetical protein
MALFQIPSHEISARLQVRVEFLLRNPPCKEGQPPDILLKLAFVPKKDPKSMFFLREAEFQQAV